MSTEIAKIVGLNEELVLTQYYAGKKHGLCLMLGRPSSIFNKTQVQQLVRELQNWLGETELPWIPCKGTRKQQKERAAALGLSDNEAIDMGIMSDEV